MKFLLCDQRISDKVLKDVIRKEQYKRCDITDNGDIILGKTKVAWWNRLINCQEKINFQTFALRVWDALVDLSTGENSIALQKGLSTEIVDKTQRLGDYEWVIERLVDCYNHVCNNKGDGTSPAGDPGKSGQNAFVAHNANKEVGINIMIGGKHVRTIPIYDSVGDHWLDVDLGIVNVRDASRRV